MASGPVLCATTPSMPAGPKRTDDLCIPLYINLKDELLVKKTDTSYLLGPSGPLLCLSLNETHY